VKEREREMVQRIDMIPSLKPRMMDNRVSDSEMISEGRPALSAYQLPAIKGERGREREREREMPSLEHRLPVRDRRR